LFTPSLEQPGYYGIFPACTQFGTPSISDVGSLRAGLPSKYQNNADFLVPVGGKLYLKLSGINIVTGDQSVLTPVLNNEEYGLPAFSSYDQSGMFEMIAQRAHAPERFKVLYPNN
jgi:hypothetical protein